MGDWSGTMDCVVTNQSGSPVAVMVEHNFDDYTDRLPICQLADREETSFTINVGSGDSDLWYVYLLFPNPARLRYRYGKACDVEQEDLQSGQPVRFNINAQDFDVATPVSSPCLTNNLSTC
jgi:hypothetical protein